MGLRDWWAAWLADQLGGPHGVSGRLVARRLNRFNATSIRAAVAALDPPVGGDVADIGFGGGLGLDLLMEAVGPAGLVHGVDPMHDMVRRTSRQRADLVDAGRLVPKVGLMEALPLDDDALDGAISCNTIYFMADLGPAFADLARVVRPGGPVVIGMADPSYFDTVPVTKHGFHVREVDAVGRALENAGFAPPRLRPVDIERTTFHLLRAELAS